MTNVLATLAYLIPSIGYCQGMNYVASALYTDSQNEELTFNLFLSLLHSKNLLPLYSNNLLDYHVKSFILDALLRTYLPALHNHFKRSIGLSHEVVTGQWIMTLFCGFFQYPSLVMFLDTFFLDGWLAFFRVALALLSRFKQDLMANTDIAYVAQFFHTLREKTGNLDIHEILHDAIRGFQGLNDEHLEILES